MHLSESIIWNQKGFFVVDRTTVDVHAMTKIHIYVVRMYVLVSVLDYSVHAARTVWHQFGSEC